MYHYFGGSDQFTAAEPSSAWFAVFRICSPCSFCPPPPPPNTVFASTWTIHNCGVNSIFWGTLRAASVSLSNVT